MGINGKAVATQAVVSTAAVTIELEDAGEIRRLGRILLGATNLGGRTGAFATDLVEKLGFNAQNTAKS